MNSLQKIFGLFLSILALNLAFLSCNSSNQYRIKNEALIFLPDSLPEGKVGEYYEAIVIIQNAKTPVSAFRLKEGKLPSGLTIYECGGNQKPCEDDFKIVGIPDKAGIFEFKVGVSCFGTNVKGQSGSKTYTVKIKSDFD